MSFWAQVRHVVCRSGRDRRNWPLLLLGLGAGLSLLLAAVSSALLAFKVFPEVGMVVNSQCSNPTPSWNGKIFELQVWKNTFSDDPKFNTYKDTTADRRLQALHSHTHSLTSRLLKGNATVRNRRKKRRNSHTHSHTHSNSTVSESSKSITAKIGSAFEEFRTHTVNDYNKYPLILWGSHHKTGTYLAQKIFAVMCAQMKWCCVYHVTRDSVHSIRQSLQSEPVHLLGHTQWVWLPEELGVPYKFIHLFRHPYKKIISGFRYHQEGAEAWCKQPLYYNRSCELLHRVTSASNTLVEQAKRENSFVSSKKSRRVRKKKLEEQQQALREGTALVELERNTVQSYCKSVHLCEPCCRREHELAAVTSSLLATTAAATASHTHATELITAGSSHYEGKRHYALRHHREYEFMCDNLRVVNVSLMETLNTAPLESAIRVEAAVDYYESLRMARIINHTRTDPASLNIDLDHFMGNYAATIDLIMDFLSLPLSEEVKASLVQNMQFYDISTSYYYRMVMTNPLTNHVDTKGAEVRRDMMALIKQDQTIVELYAPILELMRL